MRLAGIRCSDTAEERYHDAREARKKSEGGDFDLCPVGFPQVWFGVVDHGYSQLPLRSSCKGQEHGCGEAERLGVV
jgi:hypothetical protein